MTDEPKLPAGLKPGDLVVVMERNGSHIPLGVPLPAAPANPNFHGFGDFGVRHPNDFTVRNFHSDREGTEWKRADHGVRRFRTTVENAICMGVPVGTKFTLRDGSSRVEFDDPRLLDRMVCTYPDDFVRKGEIEELGTQPRGIRWTPELLAECRNKDGTPFNKMSPAAQALLKAENEKAAIAVQYLAYSDRLWHNGVSPGDFIFSDTLCYRLDPAWTPEGGLADAPIPEATKNPRPKETKMTPIKIETATLVNGVRIDHYDADARSELLRRHEAEIKRLEALEFKTRETKDEIAALRAGVEDAILAFDEDYAKRKAAKGDS